MSPQTSIIPITGSNAARPAPAPQRSVLDAVRRIWAAFQQRRQSESLRTSLQALSDRELIDIGLTRAEIDYVTAEPAIDGSQADTTYPWGRDVG